MDLGLGWAKTGTGTARAFGSANGRPAAAQSVATNDLQADAGPGDSARVAVYVRVGHPEAGPGHALLYTARAFGSAVNGRWRVERNWLQRRGGGENGDWTPATGSDPGDSRRVRSTSD